MKTNLEELNYRFRKELLNNYGYRLYFNTIAQIEQSSNNPAFAYDYWVKGLLKKDGSDSYKLVEFLESCGIFVFEERCDWEEQYSRGYSEIDFLNMSYVCSSWVNLVVQQNEQDFDIRQRKLDLFFDKYK